jgi:hypothetical protein
MHIPKRSIAPSLRKAWMVRCPPSSCSSTPTGPPRDAVTSAGTFSGSGRDVRATTRLPSNGQTDCSVQYACAKSKEVRPQRRHHIAGMRSEFAPARLRFSERFDGAVPSKQGVAGSSPVARSKPILCGSNTPFSAQ